jgi:hypothetical protein
MQRIIPVIRISFTESSYIMSHRIRIMYILSMCYPLKITCFRIGSIKILVINFGTRKITYNKSSCNKNMNCYSSIMYSRFSLFPLYARDNNISVFIISPFSVRPFTLFYSKENNHHLCLLYNKNHYNNLVYTSLLLSLKIFTPYGVVLTFPVSHYFNHHFLWFLSVVMTP